ncbi:39S ribosomal protein L51-like protein [Leptotrombidium deliense]|uniref:Large ribosomal subunit protein mL51 n=1 Tax=Leptotrombidium deliense TaxID=299467 RepID=A0A443RY04_9ACAR|nr:39S ribosomal protein L51-like protein [Leptotrombidium deliense]
MQNPALNSLKCVFTKFRFLSVVPKRNCYSDPNEKQYEKWERRKFTRRFGYEPHYHAKGLLPRLKEDTVNPLSTLPHHRKPDPWHKREALFGQNDYIDILGDSDIKPWQVVKGVPDWLKGYKARELNVLQRKMHHFKHFQWTRPKKWYEMEKRIDYLFKFLNFKKKPPNFRAYQTKL